MDNNGNSSWRTGLPQDSRQKIVKRIMDTLQRHMPPTGQESIGELLKIAWRFEEKIFHAATDQQDYLRKISLKMLSLETKAQATPANAMQGRLGGGQGVVKSLDPGATLLMQNGAQNLGNAAQLPGQVPGQTQQRQQLLAQSLQNNLTPNVMQSSSGLGSSLSGLNGIPPTPLSASTSQNMLLNAQRMQAMHQQQRQQQQQQQQQQQLQQQPQQQQQQQPQQQPSVHQQQLMYQQQRAQQQQIYKQKMQQQQQQSLLQQQQQQSLQQQVPPLQQQQQQPTNQMMSQTGNVPLTFQQQQQQLMQTQLLQQQKQQQQQQSQQQQQQQLQQQPTALHSQSQQSQQSQQPNPSQQLAQQPQQLQQLQSGSQQLGQQPPQQRLQQPGALNPQQPIMYDLQQHQKQRAFPESSTASVDSSGHSGAVVGLDHREVVWPKLQVLKDKYLQDMKELYGMLTTRSTMPMPPEQLQKLKHYKDVLHRMIPYLTVPKERVPREFNQDKVEAFEKQIVNIMETFKRRRQTPQQPAMPPQLPPNQGPQPPQQPQQQQQQQHQQQQQQFLSQIQQQDNKQMQQQPTSSTLHSSNLSSIIQNVGSALQQTGISSLQQTGLNAAQPHATALQTSNVNPSPQTGVTSLQPSGVSAMQQTGVSALQQNNGINALQQNNGINALQQNNGINALQQNNGINALQQNNGINALQQNNGINTLQQNNGNPLQQSVANSLQPNGLNSLQPSGTNTHQPAVVNNLQQPNGVGTLQQQSGSNPLQPNGVNSLLPTGTNTSQGSLQQQQLLHVQQQQRLLKDQEQAKQQLQHRQLQQQQLLQQQQQQQQQQLHHQQQQLQQQQHHQQKLQAQMHGHQLVQHNQQLPDISQSDAFKGGDNLKAKQVAVKNLLQHQQLKQRQMFQQQLLQQQQQQQAQQQQQLKLGSPQMTSQSVSSPQILQAPSPQISISQQLSPQTDHQNFTAPLQIPKVGTPLQAATPPLKTPSPSMLPVASPPLHEEIDVKIATPAIATPGSVQTLQSSVATPNNLAGIGTPGPSVSPLMVDFSPSPAAMGVPQDVMHAFSPGTPLVDKTNLDPVDRLTTKIDSIPAKSLSSAVGEMNAVISCNDKLGASAPGNGSRAAVGEDLASVTKARVQARVWTTQDSSSPVRKKSRHMDSVALSLVSSDGSVVNSLHRAEGFDALETGSMINSNIRTPRMKVPLAIREEIRQINDRLIDTEVAVSEEGTEEAAAQGKEGIVVTCSYKGVAVSPSLTQNKMISLPRVWLILPASYPLSSPVYWLDHMAPNSSFPVALAARDEFVREVRSLIAPVTLKAIAACWDRCARNALAETARHHGGGTLSTSIGVWENYVRA